MRRKVRKIAGAIFLALAIAFSQVPASFVEAISPGTDFKRDGNTLISYTGTASVVSVPAGIRVISTDAFAGNQYLERVTIPSSVEVIENGAFRDCPKLDAVYFSEGLHTIESGAFSNCPELDTVQFSSTITNLGAGVFSGDRELKSVSLGKNTYFSVFDGALYTWDKTKLIQVFAGRKGDVFDMPDTVQDIERYAFWGCKNLEMVELSAHLTEIPEYSFSNCKNLESIAIPYSIRKISAKAFEDCVSLETITLPPSVTNIHSTAFDGCYDLKISAQEGTPAYEFARAFETTKVLLMEQEELVVSENSIGSIYKDSAPGKHQEDSEDEEEVQEDEEETKQTERSDVYDPSNPADVSKLNVYDYYGPDSADVIGKTRVVGGKAVVLYDNSYVQDQPPEAVEEETEFKPDFIVPDDGSHTIAKKEYYQSTSMKKMTMDATIEKIDDFAFARSNLEEVVIPEGVSHIGYGAFYHCDNLKKIEIPSTVSTIEPEAFAQTKYLSSWKSGADADDFLVVGDGILLAYKGNAARVYLPENVKKIAGNVFQNHAELQTVVLNDGLQEIGEDAFSGCTSLSVVSGGRNVKKICDRAFAMCPLQELSITSNVSEIGLGAYKLATPYAVIFENAEELPCVSYEKTATRLENEDYRSLVFSDIDTAVVADETIEIKNTVLDERYLGFRGIVVSVSKTDSGKAKLVYCTMYPNEVSGLVEVPSVVRVGDKNYSLTSAALDAFDAYETYDYWGNGEIKGIILPPSLGKLSDYDTQFSFPTTIVTGEADEAENEDTNVSSDEENAEEDSSKDSAQAYVTTIVLSCDYEAADKITAEVLDDDTKYLLYVDKDQDAGRKLAEAVSKEFGTLVDGQLVSMNLTMVETASNVPITNFGDTKVELWIPISAALTDQNICIVTLDESGRLQTVYGTKQTKEDQNYFVFRTNHFSAYGIYAGLGEIGEQIKAESERLLQKDVSPETGEWFNPKWLLVIASLLAGLALLISPPNFKKR